MKKLTILICATLISVASVMAQNIDINASNFPDANFRNYLLAQTYGSDAILTPAEIAGINSMYVSSMNISDLTGIGFFTALERLECNNNQLTSLDVSSCTTLQLLNCNNNQLTSLDVSNNPALRLFSCYGNQLTSLDVSNNPMLEELSCWDNQLTSIDISNNPALTYIFFSDNQLTTIDIINNPALTNIYCSNNQIPLSDLYVFNNVTATKNNKRFGFQQLSPVAATVGAVVDWSPLPAQNVFDGIYTTYDVRIGSSHVGPYASPCDYTVSNGNITFNTYGTYTVIMDNAALECRDGWPVQVVATITVSGESSVPVTDISGIPICTPVGNMALIGTVEPSNATQQDIIWSVVSGSASISGTTLTTTAAGSVTVRATISDGGLCGSDYTQDFEINVLEAVTDVTYTPGVVSTGNPFTLGVGLSVTPSTVTDYVIAWQVVNAGTTGAKIGGNILKATAGGTVTVRVYVIHNACGHVLFTKDYSITVNDGCCN